MRNFQQCKDLCSIADDFLQREYQEGGYKNVSFFCSEEMHTILSCMSTTASCADTIQDMGYAVIFSKFLRVSQEE